jgi:hypothetical protein
MRASLQIGLLALLAAGSAGAADYSVVVLNKSSKNSLVRFDSYGRFVATIANGAGGSGLATDRDGNYIVAALGSLLRVTPSGKVATIAKAPSGSQWISVAQGPGGAFLAVDNRQHAVWRVSEDGQTTTKLLSYPAPANHLESASLAPDGEGNFLLLEENPAAQLFRFDTSGDLVPIALSRPMAFCWGLVADGPGSYLAVQPHVPFGKEGSGSVIVRLSSTGEVTDLGRVGPGHENIAVVRDPNAGGFLAIVNFQHSLLRISSDGLTVINLANDPVNLPYPSAILIEAVK